MLEGYASSCDSQEVSTLRPKSSPAEAKSSIPFESDLLMHLSGLVNRWASHDFRQLHAGRLTTNRDYYANEVLYVLAWHGPSRPSFIAEQVGASRANISKVVNRLEEYDLVSRAINPVDSRSTLVALTSKGKKEAKDLFRIGRDMLKEMTADWTPTELEQFTLLMQRMNQSAAEYEQRLRPGGRS